MDGLNHPKVKALKALVENELHEPVLINTKYCEFFRNKHGGICNGCESDRGCDNLVNRLFNELVLKRKEQKRLEGERDGLL